MHAHPEGIRTKGRDGQDEAVERGGLEQIFSSVNRCLPDRTDMEIEMELKRLEREEELPLARGQGQARLPPWARVGAMNPTMVPELLGRGTTIR